MSGLGRRPTLPGSPRSAAACRASSSVNFTRYAFMSSSEPTSGSGSSARARADSGASKPTAVVVVCAAAALLLRRRSRSARICAHKREHGSVGWAEG
eukprot:362560-Chlamydomonas_euryale.AAC.2